MQPSNEKIVKLARIEGETAILSGADGTEIRWKAADLPAALLRGEETRVRLHSAADEAARRGEVAAAVLNELLRPQVL